MNEIHTKDLALAALLSMQQPVIRVSKDAGGNRGIFFFEELPDTQKTINEYWCGESRVNPQLFFNQIKLLKQRLHAQC